MFDTVYSFLSFAFYTLLCCTVAGLELYYLAIQPLAAGVLY